MQRVRQVQEHIIGVERHPISQISLDSFNVDFNRSIERANGIIESSKGQIESQSHRQQPCRVSWQRGKQGEWLLFVWTAAKGEYYTIFIKEIHVSKMFEYKKKRESHSTRSKDFRDIWQKGTIKQASNVSERIPTFDEVSMVNSHY